MPLRRERADSSARRISATTSADFSASAVASAPDFFASARLRSAFARKTSETIAAAARPRNDDGAGDDEHAMAADRLAEDVPAIAAAGFDGLAAAVPVDVAEEVAGGGVAALRLLREGLERDRVEVGIDAAGARDDGGGGSTSAIVRTRSGRLDVPRPGMLSREQPVEQEAERVDVGAHVDLVRVAAELLGRRPVQRPDELARRRVAERGLALGHDLLREAEVEDARVAGRVDQHVAGLQVAMDHALQVRVLDRFAHLAEERERFADREAPVGEEAVEREAVDELHREPVPALGGRAAVEHGHDARDGGGRPRSRLRARSGRVRRASRAAR